MEMYQRKNEEYQKKSEEERDHFNKVMEKFKAQKQEEQEAMDSSMHDLDRRFDEKTLMYKSNLDYKVTKAKDTNRLLEQKAI